MNWDIIFYIKNFLKREEVHIDIMYRTVEKNKNEIEIEAEKSKRKREVDYFAGHYL